MGVRAESVVGELGIPEGPFRGDERYSVGEAGLVCGRDGELRGGPGRMEV